MQIDSWNPGRGLAVLVCAGCFVWAGCSGNPISPNVEPEPEAPEASLVCIPGPDTAPLAANLIDERRQLFVDDVMISDMEEVVREFHPAEKHTANPLVWPDLPWEGTMLALNGSILRDPTTGLMRMYYGTFERPGVYLDQFRVSHVCLAESYDGINWTKPTVGVIESKGSTDNNLIIESDFTDLIKVSLDPNDPDPQKRYKMSVFDYRDGLTFWTSSNGVTDWERSSVNPIPGADQQTNDVTVVGWDPVLKKYVAYVKLTIEGVRKRAISLSDQWDEGWTEPRIILEGDELDNSGDQTYSMEGFPYGSQWLAYVRMYRLFGGGNVDTELAISRDGLNWARHEERQAFVPNGEEDTWDDGYLTMSNNPPVRMGDELWIYYGGTNNTKREEPFVGGIGLATLRYDGFASLQASGEAGGAVQTTPVMLKYGRLCINGKTEGDGHIQVEMLDSGGTPIPGFTKSDIEPMQGDETLWEVEWYGATSNVCSINGEANEPVMIRFHLKDASLYSYWTTDRDRCEYPDS